MPKLTAPAAAAVLLLAVAMLAAGAADDADSPAVADLKRRVTSLEEQVKKLEDRVGRIAPAPAPVGPRQSRINAATMIIQQLSLALDMFETDNGRYPTTEEGLNALAAAPPAFQQTWKGPYLKNGKIPKDPWDNAYRYRYPGKVNAREYDLVSAGPDGKEGTADDISNWGPGR